MNKKLEEIRNRLFISYMEKITIVDLRTYETNVYKGIDEVPEKYNDLYVYEIYMYDKSDNIVPEATFGHHYKIVLNDTPLDTNTATIENIKVGVVFEHRNNKKTEYHQLIHIYTDDGEKPVFNFADLRKNRKTVNSLDSIIVYDMERITRPNPLQGCVSQSLIKVDKCFGDYISDVNGKIYHIYK